MKAVCVRVPIWYWSYGRISSPFKITGARGEEAKVPKICTKNIRNLIFGHNMGYNVARQHEPPPVPAISSESSDMSGSGRTATPLHRWGDEELDALAIV